MFEVNDIFIKHSTRHRVVYEINRNYNITLRYSPSVRYKSTKALYNLNVSPSSLTGSFLSQFVRVSSLSWYLRVHEMVRHHHCYKQVSNTENRQIKRTIPFVVTSRILSPLARDNTPNNTKYHLEPQYL